MSEGEGAPVGRSRGREVGENWKRRGVAAAGIMAAMLCAYGYGVISHRYEIFPYHFFGWILRGGAFDGLASRGGYDVSVDRPQVPCAGIGPRTLVLVTFGQSNSANSGKGRFARARGVYNFNIFEGHCFEARDPLLGAGGDGGSVWIPLASRIIESDLAANVVIAPIGLGGTRVEDWAPGGSLSGRFSRLDQELARGGLRVHAILWHQGESDRSTDPEAYRAAFLSLARSIRRLGSTAPIYVARATRCGDVVSRELNEQQAELGSDHPELGLRPGPDTDTLASPVWRDGCHFTQAGLVRHADLWFEKLAEDIPGLLRQFE